MYIHLNIELYLVLLNTYWLWRSTHKHMILCTYAYVFLVDLLRMYSTLDIVYLNSIISQIQGIYNVITSSKRAWIIQLILHDVAAVLRCCCRRIAAYWISNSLIVGRCRHKNQLDDHTWIICINCVRLQFTEAHTDMYYTYNTFVLQCSHE